MRVAVICSKYHPEYSGSGFRASETYKRLKKKYEVDYFVVANSIFNKYPSFSIIDGINVYRLNRLFRYHRFFLVRRLQISLMTFIDFLKCLSILIKERNEVDAVHTFGDSSAIWFYSLYALFFRKPMIRELCNSMITPCYPRLLSPLMKLLLNRKNSIVVAISKDLGELSRSKGLKNVWERPNPVDEKRFHMVSETEKHRLRELVYPELEGKKILSLLADFNPRKNQLYACELLKELPREYCLYLAGPLKETGKSYFEEIKSYIDRNNLNSRVIIKPGFLDNIDEYMKACDVFLFPSLSEGLGTPILEAQACGVPVLSNLITGVTDHHIKDGEGGFVVPCSDYPLFVECVGNCLKIEKDVLRVNSQEILKRCSSSVIDKKYIDKLNFILKKNGA